MSGIITAADVPGGDARSPFDTIRRMCRSCELAHQRCEAIADLMDHLRDLGLVLTGEPRAAIQHGRNPILTLTCDVRDATDREAHDLAHRDDEHDEVVES